MIDYLEASAIECYITPPTYKEIKGRALREERYNFVVESLKAVEQRLNHIEEAYTKDSIEYEREIYTLQTKVKELEARRKV